MKTKLIGILLVVSLLAALLPMSALAASGPVEYTIDVRNRTDQTVELNYVDADGVIHFVSIPKGVSTLTITQGVYVYWTDLKCGHLTGTINISQQRQTLWLSCDAAVPLVKVAKYEKTGKGITPFPAGVSCDVATYVYEVYDWNTENTDWQSWYTYCTNDQAQVGDAYQMNIWYDGDWYWYQYFQTGVSVDNCPDFNDYGEAFYYVEDRGDLWPGCP